MLLALIGGCGHAPEKPENPRLNQSIAISQQGHAAYRRGNFSAAIGLYEEALRLDLSIENQEGVIAGRINLSQALDASGDAMAARSQLDALLTNRSFSLDGGQRARVSAALALLALKQGQLDEAVRMIADARSSCGEGCSSIATILNIRARIELQRGDPATALASASAALPMLVALDQLAERANALRLVGEIRLVRGESADAIESLSQALAHDRDLGKPERIVDDLLLLGAAHAASGNVESAGDLYGRALSVAEAAGDPALLQRVADHQYRRRLQ